MNLLKPAVEKCALKKTAQWFFGGKRIRVFKACTFPMESNEGVYILWDHDHAVYVGQSTNILQRLGQHAKDGRTFSLVMFVNGDDLPNKSARIALEAALIGELDPIENKHHSRRWKEDNKEDNDPSDTCRDCADENGICPRDNLPCNRYEKEDA